MKKVNIQEQIVDAKKRWGFDKEGPILEVVGLMTEVGELADLVRAKYVYNKPDVPEEDKSSLKHELADVAIYLYQLANDCNVDLEKAILSKMNINDKRFNKQTTGVICQTLEKTK